MHSAPLSSLLLLFSIFSKVRRAKAPTEKEADRLGETAEEHAGSDVSKDATNLLLSFLPGPPCVSLLGKIRSQLHCAFVASLFSLF